MEFCTNTEQFALSNHREGNIRRWRAKRQEWDAMHVVFFLLEENLLAAKQISGMRVEIVEGLDKV